MLTLGCNSWFKSNSQPTPEHTCGVYPSPGGYTVDLSDWATDDWSVPEGGVKYCKHLATKNHCHVPTLPKNKKKLTNRYQTIENDNALEDASPASNMPILGSYIKFPVGGLPDLIWLCRCCFQCRCRDRGERIVCARLNHERFSVDHICNKRL